MKTELRMAWRTDRTDIPSRPLMWYFIKHNYHLSWNAQINYYKNAYHLL